MVLRGTASTATIWGTRIRGYGHCMRGLFGDTTSSGRILLGAQYCTWWSESIISYTIRMSWLGMLSDGSALSMVSASDDTVVHTTGCTDVACSDMRCYMHCIMYSMLMVVVLTACTTIILLVQWVPSITCSVHTMYMHYYSYHMHMHAIPLHTVLLDGIPSDRGAIRMTLRWGGSEHPQITTIWYLMVLCWYSPGITLLLILRLTHSEHLVYMT